MSSRVKPAEPGGSYIINAAIENEGTIVKKTTSVGVWTTCDAGDRPEGYCYITSINPRTGIAAANEKVAVYPLIEGTIIKVPLVGTNADIAYGDELAVSLNGAVDKLDGAGWVVGTSEEAVSANTGGYIRIRVEKFEVTV